MNKSRFCEFVDCAFYLAYAVVCFEAVIGILGLRFINILSDPMLSPGSGVLPNSSLAALLIYVPVHLTLHRFLQAEKAI